MLYRMLLLLFLNEDIYINKLITIKYFCYCNLVDGSYACVYIMYSKSLEGTFDIGVNTAITNNVLKYIMISRHPGLHQ